MFTLFFVHEQIAESTLFRIWNFARSIVESRGGDAGPALSLSALRAPLHRRLGSGEAGAEDLVGGGDLTELFEHYNSAAQADRLEDKGRRRTVTRWRRAEKIFLASISCWKFSCSYGQLTRTTITPGVGTWPPPPSVHPAQFQSNPLSYPTPYDIIPNNVNNRSAANFSAAQPNIPLLLVKLWPLTVTMMLGVEGQIRQLMKLLTIVVVHQTLNLLSKRLFFTNRQAKETSEPTQYGEDILSSRRDPNALKEHLLKMTADHRAGMANKRGKPLHADNGNVEIGNAMVYQEAVLIMLQTCQQRLRARGILKVEATNNSGTIKQNVACQIGTETIFPRAASWLEHWNEPVDRPGAAVNTMQHQVPSSLPENWEEALDDQQGNIAAKERSSGKPPFGKANRKDHRKRNHPEDDELDPMDPSSYSDAPRGGWVVGLKGVQPRAADTSICMLYDLQNILYLPFDV
ncbi:hypothetical protein GUJ93_ZPchr0115g2728 [Zizania palustris]|uniref:Uncharacterized protein n=1 Tax=Zizania palustris TaxID=103762 RepID=A0A8J5UUI9_ZIZPA|nr:hypothetical protein GUJ93_ZPchr0115g2728 [Zizania palustris]